MTSLTSKDRNRHVLSYIKRGSIAFFVFNFLAFKLMPIDSVLNSGTGRSTYFFQILECGNGNSSQSPKIRLKCPFVNYSGKTGKCWNQSFVTLSWPGISLVKYTIPNFDSNPWMCDFAIFPTKNNLNNAKSNCKKRVEKIGLNFCITG